MLSLTIQNDFWTCQCALALEIVILVDGSSSTYSHKLYSLSLLVE
jgi:hypothetical protein